MKEDTPFFLSDEELLKFNSLFFPRKILDENSNEIKELDDFLMRDSNKNIEFKIDLYKYLITETKNSSFFGIWIDGAKGDGISWVSERILHTFKDIKYANINSPKLYILKEDKEIAPQKLPEIYKLIGKRQFINCAIKSGLMKKSLFLTLSIIFAFIPLAFGVVGNAFKLIDITSNFHLQVTIAIFCIVGVIGLIFSSLQTKTEKRLTDFLNVIENNTISKDSRYTKLVKYLSEKISKLNSPRILIIDDFSTLHELSRNVLQTYYESKNEIQFDKELWIILNTNFAVSEQSKFWHNKDKEFPKFQYAKLESLKQKEKRELAKRLGLPKENSTCDVIKDICIEYLSPSSLQDIKIQLEKLQINDEDTFRFLYLIVSNAEPSDIECSSDALIEKIKYSKKIRERDKYIPYILKRETPPDEQNLKVYFEQIHEFLRYFGSVKFRVRNNTVQYIRTGGTTTKFQADLYHYSNGYWAMCWYFVFGKKRWKVNWIPKLAHHLKESYCIDNEELYVNVFDAHLLTIEKSIKYFYRKEIIYTIESILKLNIQVQNIIEKKYQQLLTYIAFAFFTFDYLPERNRLKEIGYDNFYDFLKKDDLNLKINFYNSENFKFLSDEIIYTLIECYWEKMLFLHISDKNYTIHDSFSELKELNTLIDNYFSAENLQSSNFTGQNIQNIALWLLINTFNISTNVFEKKQYDELVENLEDLVVKFIMYSEQHINCRNDVEQTLHYMTIQGSALIIIASLLTVRNINSAIKYSQIEDNLQKIINLYRLDIDIRDNDTAFYETLKLIQLQSLMWRQGVYINRYYYLTIIRIQLFSCWNSVYTLEAEQKYPFKNELGTIPFDNHLSIIANFTLCNLYNSYSIHNSSYYFQQACYSNIRNNIVKQVEYMFICLVQFHYYPGKIIEEILAFFAKNEIEIIDYITNNEDLCYLHFTGILAENKNADILLFFEKILERLVIKNINYITDYGSVQYVYGSEFELNNKIETAKAIWENFKFSRMSREEKLQHKVNYVNFWFGKENLFPYSRYLINLFDVEPSEDLKVKAYNFLIQDDLNYNYISSHLLLGCYYLKYQEKNREYYDILNIVKTEEKRWQHRNNLPIAEEVYETLNHCEPDEYINELLLVRLKKTNNLINNSISIFDFLCQLCFVWLKEEICYDVIDINKYIETIKLDFLHKKIFLNTYYHAPQVIINDEINVEFLLLNKVLNSILNQDGYEKNSINEFQSLINDCYKKANENIDNVIDMIVTKYPNLTEPLQKLKEQWEEQIVYDGVDEEDI